MISIFYVHLLLFFFNDTATTEIYTLSLHDALPISPAGPSRKRRLPTERPRRGGRSPPRARDRPAAASASARPHPRHRPSRPGAGRAKDTGRAPRSRPPRAAGGGSRGAFRGGPWPPPRVRRG